MATGVTRTGNNQSKASISDKLTNSQNKPKSYHRKKIVIGKNGKIGTFASPRPRFVYTGRWNISTKVAEVKHIIYKFLVVKLVNNKISKFVKLVNN